MSRPASFSSAPPILLVAGETSGDIHGAELIHALLRQKPGQRLIGTGGPRMKNAGQEQLFDLTRHAVVGLVEVLKHYTTFRRLFAQLIRLAKETKPSAVVLLDFPGFNLRLAAALRRVLPQTKLIYYISPQVWAWKSGRAVKMANLLDLLLVIFPFEKDWFARKAPRLRVEFVGHPIWDRLLPLPAPASDDESPRIALLPGSRDNEIKKHLPILIETAKILQSRHRRARFVWIAPDADKQKLGTRLLTKLGADGLNLESCVGYPLTHLSRCHLALLASGTVSLECACLGVPQIVFYQVNPLTYRIGKMVVKVNYVSMVNVLANAPIVPEFIQHDLQPPLLARAAHALLSQPEQREIMRHEMARVVQTLGSPGASARAAQLIFEQMDAPALA